MSENGHFTPDGLEYVVTTPHPPRDWVNYFWNDSFLASAAQNLNGNALYQNDQGMLTNLFGKQDRREAPRRLYVRDRDSGVFWSAGYRPCCSEQDTFTCRHGLGYSILNTEKNGLRAECRIFVPRKQPAEIWSIRITNRSRHARHLSLFPAVDIVLDGVPFPYGYLNGITAEFLGDEGFLFYRNTAHTVANERYRAFVYATRPIRRWETSKEQFLGRYRNDACPEAVERGRLENSSAAAEPMIAALQYDIRLKPGAAFDLHLVLGVVRDLAEARRIRRALPDAAAIEKAFDAVKRHTTRRLGRLRIETPDENFNRLLNTWLKHQLFLMGDWARFYFKGYRDTCQDAAGMCILDPARAIAMLRKALQNQRSDGFAPRAFRVANKGIAAADKHYADSASWIAHATDAILRETGDLALLEERIPFSDKGAGTVWEHNLAAMEFLWKDRGAHGLSLMHDGDWNDLMDKVGIRGRGESVWMSFALARVLLLVGRMAEWRGDRKTAARCKRRRNLLRKAIREHGWDGNYFLYAINDDGMRIGTHKAREGRFFINPQSWALLSEVIDGPAYEKIMRRMEPVVDTPVGPVHHWPPFTKYQDGIGQLSGTPPGFCTNGNVYCHAAAFKIAADYKAGRAEKAFESLMRILPSPEKSEPYAQANGYVGPTALRMKRHVSDDPWRTGTVAWNFINVLEGLLGFQPTREGFRLRPQLPRRWKRVRFQRPFRGTLFDITLRRGARPAIRVDAKPLKGDFIAVPPAQRRRRRVTIECVVATPP